jgi:hypothetical protein
MRRIFLILSCSALLLACAAAQQPYHGFSDQASLDRNDLIVLKESVGGSLDPMNLAMEDQRYTHGTQAYNRIEEGYYQWGQKLYAMGYRDVYYVRDLAPHAFRHEIMDTYDHAIELGFHDAEAQDATAKK